MVFAYADSFHKSTEGLSKKQATRLISAFEKFESAWEQGQIPHGLGLTHLRGNFYEFRIDIHARVIFHRERDCITYLLYGSHDDIRHFLKQLYGSILLIPGTLSKSLS